MIVTSPFDKKFKCHALLILCGLGLTKSRRKRTNYALYFQNARFTSSKNLMSHINILSKREIMVLKVYFFAMSQSTPMRLNRAVGSGVSHSSPVQPAVQLQPACTVVMLPGPNIPHKSSPGMHGQHVELFSQNWPNFPQSPQTPHEIPPQDSPMLVALVQLQMGPMLLNSQIPPLLHVKLSHGLMWLT